MRTLDKLLHLRTNCLTLRTYLIIKRTIFINYLWVSICQLDKNAELWTVKTKYQMKLMVNKPIVLALLLMISCHVSAQSIALRTNLLYDATLTPNVGAELRIDSAWTAGVNVGLNAWDINKDKNKKWRHLLVAPNVRRYYGRHTDREAADSLWGIPPAESRRVNYLELNAHYSHFNVSNTKIPFGLYSTVKDRRLQGDLVALGAKYGWSWIMARHWRIEAEGGIAVGYAWFKEYDCAVCGTYYGKGDRIFLLPQLGINVVYLIN